MKRFIYSIFLFSMVLNGYSQCEPDTNCVDIAKPGQICPDTLPSGQKGIIYDQVVTILPPDSAVVGDQTIALYKIVIDTVTNLPPGLTYTAPAVVLYPDTSYCFEITGTPAQTGTFYLKITVIPYVYSTSLDQVLAFPAQTDSTSLFITIEEPSVVNDIPANTFRMIPGSPNPFRNGTLIGVNLAGTGHLQLSVFDITGKLVYQEQKQGVEGKNFFSFRGKKLSPGIYFYNVSFNQFSQSGKLVKIK